MRLELKLALIGAISKIIIFLILFVLVQQLINSMAQSHADRDLLKMKDKTMSIVRKIGIKPYLDAEKDSAFASYNILKEEYISIAVTEKGTVGQITFAQEARVIEDEEFDYRILDYTFDVDNKLYTLEIGKNIQLIYSLERILKKIALTIILIVLVIAIVFDLVIFKYLLHPLNQMIIPKLKTVENPETFSYTELSSSTSDFVYLNTTINELMHKVNDILRSQKKFIGDVSHELFTPISVMQSKLENLLVSEKLPAKTVQMILGQQRELVRLQHIIKALLLISRIENDQYDKNDTVSLHELVEEVISNIEERAEIKNITIENNVSAKFRIVEVNKYLIYILLFNLVSNAIKYGREGGCVILSDKFEGEYFIISVEDNGIGIDPENLEIIFNRFKRVDAGSGEGYGLGLSIVRTIASFHDAKIEVRSVRGEGSRFEIRFLLKNINV